MRTKTPLLLIGLVLSATSCGDKTEPGVAQTPEASSTSTTTTGGSSTTTTGSDSTATTTGGTGDTTTGTTTGASSSPTGICGTNDTTMTYDADASVVLNATCISCHSPTGTQSSMPLDTKTSAIATFKQYGGQQQVDSKQMPLSGTLTADQICIIDYWVTQGYN